MDDRRAGQGKAKLSETQREGVLAERARVASAPPARYLVAADLILGLQVGCCCYEDEAVPAASPRTFPIEK